MHRGRHPTGLCVQILRPPPKLVLVASEAQASFPEALASHHQPQHWPLRPQNCCRAQCILVLEHCHAGVIQGTGSRGLLDKEGQYPRGGTKRETEPRFLRG